jgi:HAD superfamily hydrolase (TIGR01549 family)
MARFIFDLDGTLVDSVYQHVLAWHTALQACDLDLALWQIHRKIGMSGGLLFDALEGELGRSLDERVRDRLNERHSEEFKTMRSRIMPLPGAPELLSDLSSGGVPFAIATSGDRQDVEPFLKLAGVPAGTPTVFKDDAKLPKPDPGLLLAAAAKLPECGETIVVGDSVWDMLAGRRAHFLGVGVLTGGYAESELTEAGAYRVYADPVQVRAHLYEIGGSA